MAELVLELFSEEIPARMQSAAAEQLREKVTAKLTEEGVYSQRIKTYASPRRLVLWADGLSITQEEKSVEKRGPQTNAPQQAIDGFLRANHLKIEDLVKRDTGKGEFYFAISKEHGKPTKDVLKSALEEILTGFHWPKSMRWGNEDVRWVRPLKSIVCLFGGDILPIRFGPLVAADKSEGHRFLGRGRFTVGKFEGFKKELKDRFVMLDVEERKETILEQAHAHARRKNLELIADAGLLEEVAGLVEWPNVLLGQIDAHFLSVPEEALISSIRTNQKYFLLRDQQGSLAPYFLVVSNMTTADSGKKIIAGNERVLRARLSDAHFFWNQDRKKPLETRLPMLEKMVFHARLGTVLEKVERIGTLAGFLAPYIPNASKTEITRAARLSKADLATDMVGEFPELQGIMGYYYASHAHESAAVAEAIRDHYLPLGPSSPVPGAPTSIAIALADKLDTLAGLFAAGEIPTGSKDPFGLRRAALGVIRIILENQLHLPLHKAIEAALENFPRSLFHEEDKGLLAKIKPKSVISEDSGHQLFGFVIDRLKASLRADEVRHDLINAVFASGEDDLLRAHERVSALSRFLSTADGVNLLAGYKRAANILAIEEKKEGKTFRGNPSKTLLDSRAEDSLFTAIHAAHAPIRTAIKADRFEEAMALLSHLRAPIDAFFESVKVNVENPEVRANRLKLLASLRELCNEIADFGQIEG